MLNVITHPEEVTPQWLTHVLRQSGALPCGEVTCIQTTAEPSYTSTVARLTVTYSSDAPSHSPAHLFLKLSRPESQQRVVGSVQRRKEVEFHNRVAGMMDHPPVVRCYQAVYIEETGASHLLFDDVSETHFSAKSACPPGKPHCECAIDAFAAFHAFWWDNPALSQVESFPSPESVTRQISSIRECFARFADFLGDWLSGPQRNLYDRVLAALPELTQRLAQGKHLTLIHGDANLSNVLLPRDATQGKALLIDWQLWNISYSAEDLANLMALFWSRDQRCALERDLLMRYHTGLVQHGVKGYMWADCWYDYRLAVMERVLFMPMWFWQSRPAGENSPQDWADLPYLVNALQACEDLGCAELLAG